MRKAFLECAVVELQWSINLTRNPLREFEKASQPLKIVWGLIYTHIIKGVASTFEVVRPGSRSGLLWVCQEVGVVSFCCRLHVLIYF